MHTQKFENLSVSYHIFIQSQKNAIKEKGKKVRNMITSKSCWSWKSFPTDDTQEKAYKEQIITTYFFPAWVVAGNFTKQFKHFKWASVCGFGANSGVWFIKSWEILENKKC